SVLTYINIVFFFSSRRRHTRSKRDWSSDVCSSDLTKDLLPIVNLARSLNHLNESMETSRGVKIQQDIKHVKENLQKVKQVPEHLMPQFSKLINKIEEKVDGFTNDRRVNMCATIKWCAISGLHQQAYTFAFEYIISVMYAE